MERLTEYHGGVAVIKDKSKLKQAMEKLAKYEDAEEQGLFLRLPCEPTDEVLNMIYKLCELHSKADESYDNPKESDMKEAEAKLEKLRG